MSMWQLLLTRLTSVRATPTQHPLHRCLLPASCLPGAELLSCPFPSLQTLGCLPSFLRGPVWNRTARSCLPEAPGTPSVCQQPPLSPSLFHSFVCSSSNTLGGGASSTSAEEVPLCLGARPSRAMESWAGDPCVHLSFRLQPAASSPACRQMCELAGGVGPRVLWVQLRREASLWALPTPAHRVAP